MGYFSSRFDKQMPPGATIHEYYEGLIDILDKCVKNFKMHKYDYDTVDFNDDLSLIKDGNFLEMFDFVGLYSEL